MSDPNVAPGARGLLGVLVVAILAFTLPAYPNPTTDPGLASLTGDSASLGNAAGAFLGRQLALALIAAAAAVLGTRQIMRVGAFAAGFFNLHDFAAITLSGVGGPGAMAGLLFAALAAWRARRTAAA